MRLYHGSTVIVSKPNLDILNFKTDFGKGFYTTINMEQAKKWSKVKKERLQGEIESNKIKRYVNIYEYTEKEGKLKILDFLGATEEWLDFVYKNRTSNELLHDYDIVKGPVADDNLYATLRLYERHYISKKDTIEALKTYKLVNQISFHTVKALEMLKYIGAEEIV